MDGAGEEDIWRDFRDKFQALAGEELQRRAAQKDRFIRAYCNYRERPEVLHEYGKPEQGPFCLLQTPECGLWTLSDGMNENFQERFQGLAARAAVALGYVTDADPVDFWLHKLFHYLLEKKSTLLVCAEQGEGGIIERVCVWLPPRFAHGLKESR